MTEAPSYSPQLEIESFLENLYGSEIGFAYTPTKTDTGYWQQYWFKWPEQRDALTTHLLRQTQAQDCYVSPSLFKAPKATKQAWKGSNYVWVEFDGNAPKETDSGIPAPSIRIQSSNTGHEHWYWRLTTFETDYRALEGLAKALTYTLDADKSGWDCSQVLRPPGTLHQESGKRVRILAELTGQHSYSSFTGLVTPTEPAVVNTTFETLPDIQSVIARYKWPTDAVDLFKKTTQPIGSRSSAMTRLGFHCIEMGMTNEECYVVLLNADDRWGKYKSRSGTDRAKRLIGIISHCRGKKELDAELHLSERESFLSLGDFRHAEIKVKWLFHDFLTEQGLGVLSAAPSSGKSTLSIRLGCSVVLGTDFLVWRSAMEVGKRVGFLSLEMGGMECRHFQQTMWPSFSEEQQDLIDKNFFLLPLGYGLPLASKEAQQMIADEIDRHEIEFLIIDSLKAATSLDERKLDLFFDWINRRIRAERGTTVWLVHHNRKPPNEGPRKPRGLEDLYGDTFISAHPSTVVSLWRRGKDLLDVLPFKIRLAEETDPFTIKREKHLDFSLLKEVPSDDKPQTESNLFGS